MNAGAAAVRLFFGVPEISGWPFPRARSRRRTASTQSTASKQSTASTRSTAASTSATSPDRDYWRMMSRPHADFLSDADIVRNFLELAEVPKDQICSRLFNLMLNVLGVLRATNLGHEDILSILVLASIYYRDAMKLNPALLGQWTGCVLVLYAFLGQCHLIDVAATLKDWHTILLRMELPFNQVNKLLMRLLAMRSHLLRVEDHEFRTVKAALRQERKDKAHTT
eukprot:TRINITY_DN33376_c0_g1_i1.p1 TRINITY_DN33376_c0_g1~~TRINITY_DN33376_c0_g1_i1.p1  ORF type:complete len:225 (+),score=32.87 TRINITY_DN33376_c0_g1_i1:123-797(+)